MESVKSGGGMMTRILIGAPLRCYAPIFREHLRALDKLIIPDGVTVDRFYIANGAGDEVELLRDDEYIVRDDLAPIMYEDGNGDHDHKWTNHDTVRMGELRTLLTDKALADGYDYYFSIDTDVIVQPETLAQLLAAKRSIVSEVFWTVSDGGFEWCNAWECDNYGVYPATLDKWHAAGLYHVGMTGACTLIHRRVFETGVNYRKIPNVQHALVGEDRHFCVRAACAGFTCWLDTHYPATHLYRLSEYVKFMEARRNGDNNH